MEPVGGTVIAIVATRLLTKERDGVAASVGETVEVKPVIAAALTYQHKAKFAGTFYDKVDAVTALTDELVVTVKRKRGRPKGSGSTYTRRDLTAETPEGTE